MPEHPPDHEEIPDEVAIPVSGTLDLHQFRPSETASLVEEYLLACRTGKILTVRIVHGKGIGTQRELVHRTLGSLDFVKDFTLAGSGSGSWGATWVYLHPPLE